MWAWAWAAPLLLPWASSPALKILHMQSRWNCPIYGVNRVRARSLGHGVHASRHTHTHTHLALKQLAPRAWLPTVSTLLSTCTYSCWGRPGFCRTALRPTRGRPRSSEMPERFEPGFGVNCPPFFCEKRMARLLVSILSPMVSFMGMASRRTRVRACMCVCVAGPSRTNERMKRAPACARVAPGARGVERRGWGGGALQAPSRISFKYACGQDKREAQ